MTFTITPLGRRREIFGDDEYDAFKLAREPQHGTRWPTGPLFPEGHIYVNSDGLVLEVVSSRTRMERMSGVFSDFRYVHEYLCRQVHPDEAGSDW